MSFTYFSYDIKYNFIRVLQCNKNQVYQKAPNFELDIIVLLFYLTYFANNYN